MLKDIAQEDAQVAFDATPPPAFTAPKRKTAAEHREEWCQELLSGKWKRTCGTEHGIRRAGCAWEILAVLHGLKKYQWEEFNCAVPAGLNGVSTKLRLLVGMSAEWASFVVDVNDNRAGAEAACRSDFDDVVAYIRMAPYAGRA